MDITRENLKVVPYLDLAAIDGRHVNLMPFWDGQRWHVWVPTEKGLIELKVAEVSHMSYVGKLPAHANDIVIPFVELMWQHASWSQVCRMISAITEDFHNLGTSIEKLTHFFDNRKEIEEVAQFVKTELEYIFILSRSIFDLLQEAIAWIWGNTIRLLDPELEARRKQAKLPSTFSKMVLSGDRLRQSNELVEKYGLPEAMAEMYVAVAPFFVEIRRFRDEIVHLGKDPNMLFLTDRGFCVPNSAYGFGKASFWKPEHRENPNIVSLLPLLAHVVVGTIESCGNLMRAFAQQLQLPPPMAPGYTVFVRGPHNEALLWLLHVAMGGSPWWSDRSRWRNERIQQKAYFLWKDQAGQAWRDPVSNWVEAEKAMAPVRMRIRAKGMG